MPTRSSYRWPHERWIAFCDLITRLYRRDLRQLDKQAPIPKMRFRIYDEACNVIETHEPERID
jgi:hypothetical protein